MVKPILFTLKDIDVLDTLSEYFFHEEHTDETVIDIDTFLKKDESVNNPILFLDPNKKQIKLWLTNLAGKVYPKKYDKNCFWCRSKFNTPPLGCPLGYQDGIFSSEGFFCSFPCVKAYILDERARTKNPKYDNSLTLLTYLFFKETNSISEIPKASTWRSLKKYGGHLSIEQFRKSFDIVETVNAKQVLIAEYLEERST